MSMNRQEVAGQVTHRHAPRIDRLIEPIGQKLQTRRIERDLHKSLIGTNAVSA
jgi:hypothetical protein